MRINPKDKEYVNQMVVGKTAKQSYASEGSLKSIPRQEMLSMGMNVRRVPVSWAAETDCWDQGLVSSHRSLLQVAPC